MYDTNRYRPRGGTIAVIEAMLAEHSVDVRLSSPVTAVHAGPDTVAVTTRDGDQLRASRAVVAVPVNLWPAIDFSPALPSSHAAAARVGMGKPHLDKVWIRVRGQIGRVLAQLPAPMNFFWTYRQLEDGQLMIAINANPDLDGTDEEQVGQTIRAYLPEIEEVVSVRGHNWAADEYSRGGNTCHRPGQMTTLLAALQSPWGRVAFATTDLASGWVGYIDGAIEFGLRAAKYCRDLGAG